MKRLLLVSLLVALLLVTVVPTLAQGNGRAPGDLCGRFFGEHVSDHAQFEHLGVEHNPGMHEGFANFLEHGEHAHTCP